MADLELTTVPRDLYYHEVAYVRRLEAALRQCAADFISPPCTMQQGHVYLDHEFRRRMEIANRALTSAEPTGG